MTTGYNIFLGECWIKLKQYKVIPLLNIKIQQNIYLNKISKINPFTFFMNIKHLSILNEILDPYEPVF